MDEETKGFLMVFVPLSSLLAIIGTLFGVASEGGYRGGCAGAGAGLLVSLILMAGAVHERNKEVKRKDNK